MIDAYTYGTSNGQRVAIALEESGLPYRAHRVDLLAGEQRSAEYLALNPTGRIPTLVDRDAPGGRPLVLTQSMAIVLYIGDRSGTLLPQDPLTRIRSVEWLMFVVTDVSAPLAQAFYLSKWADETHPAAAAALRARALGFVEHLDRRLGEVPYLGGEAYSLADVAAYPTLLGIDEYDRAAFPNVRRWLAEVGTRPAVQRGMAAADGA